MFQINSRNRDYVIKLDEHKNRRYIPVKCEAINRRVLKMCSKGSHTIILNNKYIMTQRKNSCELNERYKDDLQKDHKTNVTLQKDKITSYERIKAEQQESYSDIIVIIKG